MTLVRLRETVSVDGRLEVERLEIDDWRRGKLVSPDPTSVWPRIERIHAVWGSPTDRTLVVGGLHGFETVLHSLELDETEDEVGLLARIGFTPESARRRLEASEPMLELAVGIAWCAEVRLQIPLAGRTVVDRGVSLLEVLRSEQATPLHTVVIADLERELTAKPRPAERRRIRQTIKAIRRNPLKALAWAEKQEAARKQTD